LIFSSQGVFQATYLGVGVGLGGLVGGMLMERYGGGALFRLTSVLVLLAWAAAHVVERLLVNGLGGGRAFKLSRSEQAPGSSAAGA
jgi:hypothetical protein